MIDWSRALRAIPDWPRRRYNTFAGTNLWSEWWAAWRALAAAAHDDEAVLREYEESVARQTGCEAAFSFGAGRMGLFVLLEALDLQAGDEIVLPGFTCVVVPNALIYRGVRPVYVDIDPVTFNLNPMLVEAAITPRTRAIYMQHTFGVSCDVDAIKQIADRHRLLLIEDGSHSLGARHSQGPHGSRGDVAFFSTDRTKVINTHLGGVVTTRDPGIARRLGQLQKATAFPSTLVARRILFSFLTEFLWYSPALLWLGRPVASALRLLGVLFYWRDEPLVQLPEGYPYPVRLSSGQARLGLSQLADLERNLAHRRQLARWLEARIGWYGSALPGPFDEQAWLRYSFMIEDRDEFERRLRSRFDIPFWFTSVVYGRDRDLHLVGYEQGSCPIAEKVARHVVNLPTHLRIPQSALEDLWRTEGHWIQSQVRRLQDLET